MALGEFELIERWFAGSGARRDDVIRGVGDDAALVQPPPGQQLALATDTIVEGVHFPAGLEPRAIGHRLLATNLSDLAAMGAVPAWALLALTLPRSDEAWLEAFAGGLDELARRTGTALIGGDTTSGPLVATLCIAGFVPPGQALCRSGARPGDLVFVSGHPGEAVAGLGVLQGDLQGDAAARAAVTARFLWPEPRLELGLALRGLASACIDVSDGLAGDLQKLCAASGVGARIDVAALPLSAALVTLAGQQAARLCLAGGDDYELLFTAPAGHRARIESLGGVRVTAIGEIVAGSGLAVAGFTGPPLDLGGYDHFRS